MAAMSENMPSLIEPAAPASTTPAAPAKESEHPKEDARESENLLPKLNPLAKEFFPSDRVSGDRKGNVRLSADAQIFVSPSNYYWGFYSFPNGVGSVATDSPNRKKKSDHNVGKQRANGRIRRPDWEDSTKRTVYVSNIDKLVTEESLAAVFSPCGHVVDCRICGDPHSPLRFAFIEFSDEDGVFSALELDGTSLGFGPLRVLPSKTAILPVNPKLLPQTEKEKEMVMRTVYCTNIDKKVTQADIKVFFEQLYGEVSRLRLLGDSVHSTRIAFIEFTQAESAIAALNGSGIILGTLPVRVSPSKTPVKVRFPRAVTSMN